MKNVNPNERGRIVKVADDGVVRVTVRAELSHDLRVMFLNDMFNLFKEMSPAEITSDHNHDEWAAGEAYRVLDRFEFLMGEEVTTRINREEYKGEW